MEHMLSPSSVLGNRWTAAYCIVVTRASVVSACSVEIVTESLKWSTGWILVDSLQDHPCPCLASSTKKRSILALAVRLRLQNGTYCIYSTGWLLGINGTFHTVRLYHAFKNYSLLKRLILVITL